MLRWQSKCLRFRKKCVNTIIFNSDSNITFALIESNLIEYRK